MIIGIDLGTTNSLVAVWRDGKSELIPNALGSFLTPSVVGLDDDGRIIVGQAAKDRLFTHPQLTVAVFKRLMGSQASIKLGQLELKPQELSSFVLRQLKEDVEAFTGQAVTEAVITVPAYFSDAQRKMTQLAGRLAGLQVERLLNEPTAAALAYGVHEQQESQFLVFDLGGGTFDVSVLEMFEGVMEVRASAGDNRLGGEDFTALVAGDLIGQLQAQGLSEEQLRGQYLPNIMAEAERCKNALSSSQQYNSQLSLDGQAYALHYSRETFEKNSQPLLQRLQTPVRQALKDCAIAPAALDRVLLVGGATRMPMIGKMVAQMFGKLPSRELNPDQVVALGAAVQAALKARDKSVEEVVLTDVCPYTLGIEVMNEPEPGRFVAGIFSPIIERNATIPLSKKDIFYTTRDEQKIIRVKVFQGEARLTQHNIFLGDLDIDVPANKAGQEAIEVRFSYDINGLLEVEVKVLSTRQVKSVVINQQHLHLSETDIQASLQKLAALKMHPRENAQNIAFLARANRLYEQHLGPQRQAIGELLDYFSSVLDGDDMQRIDETRAQLERQLATYEL
ncbi:MAG: molecular chaperone HscC [Oceanospirillaceae bacterium]|nr:molecular chaperone HscC [Oceanospirillaceae bacterium]MCP5335623.1 molecular chaperone HscC [Oceanospirillaceae bacterium]